MLLRNWIYLYIYNIKQLYAFIFGKIDGNRSTAFNFFVKLIHFSFDRDFIYKNGIGLVYWWWVFIGY